LKSLVQVLQHILHPVHYTDVWASSDAAIMASQSGVVLVIGRLLSPLMLLQVTVNSYSTSAAGDCLWLYWPEGSKALQILWHASEGPTTRPFHVLHTTAWTALNDAAMHATNQHTLQDVISMFVLWQSLHLGHTRPDHAMLNNS